MQGTAIPRCYASILVNPSPADSGVPEASVYGLILEDVGGVDLSNVDVSSGDYTALGHCLMAAVHQFPAYGVLHADIRSANIVISSPTRIVVLDFGHAILRTADINDEDWEERVERREETVAIGFILQKRHIRDMSPLDNRGTELQSCFNGCIGQYSNDWIERWYHDVHLTEPIDESIPIQERLHWRLRDEVAGWFDSRLPAPLHYLVPRPGSPESHAVPTSWLPVHSMQENYCAYEERRTQNM